MAQAGLASSADVPGQHHMLDEVVPGQRAKLIQLAGGNPAHHSSSSKAGHPASGHTGKKNKGKGKKNHMPDLETTVTAITKGVMQSMQHAGTHHANTSTHNKDKPFFGVPSARLYQVYSTSLSFHTKAVAEALVAIDAAMAALPGGIRLPFNAAFTMLKQYRTGNQQYTYENVYAKISEAHAAYAALHSNLKYSMHMPHNIPVDRSVGVVSLLSKLMSLTIDTLQVHTIDLALRKQYGYYEFKTQRRNITEAKKNSDEVQQAWVRAKAIEKKAEERKTGVPGHHMTHPSHQSHMPGHPAPGAASEFGADHGSFSMAHPYTP